jgi:O-antigen/teichoic acid export membrane protein
LLPDRELVRSSAEEVSTGTVGRYVAADYVGALCELAVVNLVPLVIAAQLGLEAVAYFGPTWMIGTMLEHVLVHYGASLTVEAAAEPHRLAELSRELLRRSLLVVVPLVVVIVAAAPLLLGLYGSDFPGQVGPLLRLCALALLPRLLIHVVLTAARVRRDVRSVVGLQVALAVLTFAVSLPLLDRFGLTAPAIGYLVASVVVAAAVTPRLVRLLREGRP